MEKKLRALFDYQRFEGNAELQQVIDSVHARYAGRNGTRELRMEEMEMVSAAGQLIPERMKNERN